MTKYIGFVIITAFLLIIACGGSDNRTDGPQYHKEERAQSPTIAKVGASEIKLFMLDEFSNMYALKFETAQEEYDAKKAYLDSLINLYILVEAAYKQDLHKDPEVMQAVEDSKPEFMREELFREKILPKIIVTDEEVQKWYDNLDKEIRLSIIFITDSTLADSVYQAVNKGADFAAAAKKYSDDNQTKFDGGDFGWRSFDNISEDFQNKVFNNEVGKVVIFKDISGWDIVKVTDRRDVDIQPLEEIEDALKMQIQSIKRANVQGEFFQEIFDKNDIQINQETAEFILDKIETLYPDVIGGVPFRKNTFNPDDLAQYERNMVLATYKGGEVLLGDYLRQTSTWQDAQRPPFSEIEDLREAIFRLRLMDILEAEARDLNVEDSPNYKDAIRFYKDQLMAVKLKDVIIQEKSFVSDEEVAEYYRTHQDEFIIPQKLHVLEILAESEVQADNIIKRLDKGEDFGALPAQFTTRPGKKNNKGDMGLISENNYPTLYETASNLQVNQYSKPFPVGDKWSIVKLLEVQPKEVKAFDQVARVIKSDLENQKRELALSDWFAENRSKIKIDIDYDMIWKTIDKDSYEN